MIERVINMAISLRLSDREDDLFRRYADMKGISVSEMVRRTVLSKIEDEFDLQAYDKAFAEYQKNPVTYTHEEVRKMLELD